MLKTSLYSPAGGHLCYVKLAHSSTKTTSIYLSLYRYLFEGCYFGAIRGAPVKMSVILGEGIKPLFIIAQSKKNYAPLTKTSPMGLYALI